MANIGQGIDRVDGRLKVTGRAHYAAEFAVPDVVHAVLVQSTIGAGAITGFDLAAAQKMPGVLAIITPDNAPKLHTQGGAQQTVRAPLLQDRDIHYNGQHVAVVVAETLEQADAAGALVRVQYRRDEPITSMDAVLDQAYAPKNFRNGERSPDSRRGDPDAAFDGAAVKVDATYITPIEHHNPMEPHATIARWEGNRLTVWTATQGISGAQQTLAGLFGIDQSRCPCDLSLCRRRLRVQGQHLATGNARCDGGKGCGQAGEACTDARADVHLQRLSPAHHAEAAVCRGRSRGILCRCGTTASRKCRSRCLANSPSRSGLATEMLYACPNVAVTHRLVATNASLPTYMRAPGLSSGDFALESAIDELAVALKQDPLEFRLRNYTEQEPHLNRPFASKVLRECYRQGADAFGWSRRSHEPRSMRDGNVLIGWGMATSTYPTHRMPASVHVRVAANGTALGAGGHTGHWHRHLHGNVADRGG